MRVKAGIYNKINDVPLNYKFFLIYIICIIIPIVFVNALFMSKTSNLVKAREEDNMKISADRAVTDLKGIFEDCIAVGNSVIVDKDLYKIMNKNYQDESEYYEDYNIYLRDKIEKYIYTFKGMSSLSVYTTNLTIGSGGNFHKLDNSLKESNWLRRVRQANSKLQLIAYTEAPQSAYKRYYNNLCLVRKLNMYPELQQYELYLKISIDADEIYNIFNREAKYTKFVLIDNLGQIAFSTSGKYELDIKDGLKKENIIEYDKNSMVFEKDFGNADYLKDWKLICIGDKEKMLNELSESRLYIILIACLCTIISSIMIYVIVSSYNFRIKKLSKHIRKVQNQQFEPVNIVEGKDEIGGLICNFNMMTERINSLVNDVLKLEIQKKNLELEQVRAELNFLQSQMNPHFLFNTLNAMMVVCVKNNYTDVIEIIKYLSKTLRRLLDWKEDIVNVSEEVEFIEMYLRIEKFRFQDKFDYVIRADENVLACRLPKLTIQPLVENACKHGIQTIKGVGKIEVNISRKDGKIEVSVEDNGCGMEQDRVEDILEDIHCTENCDGRSIGLRNVFRRLKLYYGDTLEFKIESEIGRGTRIFFRITD